MHHHPPLHDITRRRRAGTLTPLRPAMLGLLLPLLACAGRPGGPAQEQRDLAEPQADAEATDACTGLGDPCTIVGSTDPSRDETLFVTMNGAVHLQVGDTTVDEGKYVFDPDAPSSSTTWDVEVPSSNNGLINRTVGSSTTVSTPWGWCAQDQDGTRQGKHHTQTDTATTIRLAVPASGDDATSYALRIWGCVDGAFVSDDPKIVVRPKQTDGSYSTVKKEAESLSSCHGEPADADQACVCITQCIDTANHSTCGWCETTQLAMAGTASGPTNGTCEKWIPDHDDCPRP